MAPGISSTDPATVDLRCLIGHSAKVAGDMMVEMVQSEFARTNADFLAMVDGDELLGVCARRELIKR
jgi:hypothetical protein